MQPNPVELVAIFCGDRNWTDPGPIHRILDDCPADHCSIIITGAAKGADSLAHLYALKLGMKAISIPAPWGFYGTRAGPVRNQWMLDLLIDIRAGHPESIAHIHAFHDNLSSSKGTADMLSRARHAGIPITIHSSCEHADV